MQLNRNFRPAPTSAEWAPYWQQQIAAAQHVVSVTIDGATFRRVPYRAALGAPSRCRDCGCGIGQYHVPDCCVERCPRCGIGQAISCDCDDGDTPKAA